jgi:hypothetical protein
LCWKVIQDCPTQGFSYWEDYNGRIHWACEIRRDHFRSLPWDLSQCLQWYFLQLHRAISNSAFFPDSASEKPARGTIFTSLQRQLAVDRILILDSLNYIKGFRYQIYCAAREMKLRTCTVHPTSHPDSVNLYPEIGPYCCDSRFMSGMEFSQVYSSSIR